ncbi:hypothetical protein SLEP1_g2166 [Rubroshorea leprosula]|uniref:Uncharacterized protein n=1 Tax=Rubroshorea leprosula TaxID=152421 RepID=A0AAV5HGA0_9ROSI|nr:hypothetical protein SLEP1_g2166 [Rubroshorea leprosula]
MRCFAPIPLCIMAITLSFFFFCSPVAGSESDFSGVIQLPTDVDVGDGEGVCAGVAKPASCPVSCFRTVPVCGVDGVTYWCGCADAICAGTPVAKLGFCQVGSGGSASLPGQALLLVHIVWLILLGFSLFCGLF